MQRSALCRSRRDLSNEYFFAKFGFDIAENEPCQVCPIEQRSICRRIYWEGRPDLVAGVDAAAGARGVHGGLVQQRGRRRQKRKSKHRSGSWRLRTRRSLSLSISQQVRGGWGENDPKSQLAIPNLLCRFLLFVLKNQFLILNVE